jgi:hypothetical protein
MSCVRDACHCQSEIFLERDGVLLCSEHCASFAPAAAAPCGCQHPGCAGSDEQTLAEGMPPLAEDMRLG